MPHSRLVAAPEEKNQASGHPLRSNAGLCFAGTEAPAAGTPAALAELPRFIVTCGRNRFQFFWFASDLANLDSSHVYVASESAFHLGVLSSMIHITWARAAGGRHREYPVYSPKTCFEPFPFPDPAPERHASIGALAQRLDQHRTEAIARDERVSMTDIYNIVTKLRSTAVFSPAERAIHQSVGGRVLREMHQELDRLVAQAYGWRWPMNKPEILSKLAELLEHREAEERGGTVRWLRPDFQIPRFGNASDSRA